MYVYIYIYILTYCNTTNNNTSSNNCHTSSNNIIYNNELHERHVLFLLLFAGMFLYSCLFCYF